MNSVVNDSFLAVFCWEISICRICLVDNRCQRRLILYFVQQNRPYKFNVFFSSQQQWMSRKYCDSQMLLLLKTKTSTYIHQYLMVPMSIVVSFSNSHHSHSVYSQMSPLSYICVDHWWGQWSTNLSVDSATICHRWSVGVHRIVHSWFCSGEINWKMKSGIELNYCYCVCVCACVRENEWRRYIRCGWVITTTVIWTETTMSYHRTQWGKCEAPVGFNGHPKIPSVIPNQRRCSVTSNRNIATTHICTYMMYV